MSTRSDLQWVQIVRDKEAGVLKKACDIIERQAEELDQLKLAVCPLKAQLREARETALWAIEKEKMQRQINLQAEEIDRLTAVTRLCCNNQLGHDSEGGV